MSKTVIWVLVGVLAVAGAAAAAFISLRPDKAGAALAAATTDGAKGTTVAASSAAAPVAAVPAPSPSREEGAIAATSGTGGSEPAALSAAPTIDQLIQNVAAYEGAAISLSGTILTQCVAGCEFALDDGTGVLSVQLEGKAKDRLIPQGKVGRKIAVQGTFRGSPRPQVVIEDPNGWQFVK